MSAQVLYIDTLREAEMSDCVYIIRQASDEVIRQPTVHLGTSSASLC